VSFKNLYLSNKFVSYGAIPLPLNSDDDDDNNNFYYNYHYYYCCVEKQ